MYFLNRDDLLPYLNNIAVVFKNNKSILRTLKYSEVLEMSEIICSHLSKYIINKHLCIGLIMRHNVLIPSIILSLQKLQHAFIFMEPTETDENKFIVDEMRLKWLITHEKASDLSTYNCHLILSLDVSATDQLYLWEIYSADRSERCLSNICYAIRTSGTTGTKKIVYVENECIFSNIKNLRNLFDLKSSDIVYFGTSLTFDPSMIELFLTMISGATLQIVPHKYQVNFQYLLSGLFNEQSSVTILQMPPSLLMRWNETDLRFIFQKSSLRILGLGGEPFPETILNIEKSRKLKIFNLYGITEVSCWASAYEINKDTEEIYLGQPLDDTLFNVRNDSNANVTNGVGELYIGSHVRVCHVNEIKEHPQNFHATGDLVQINNVGIKYLGRINNVIKRFGHRVDLNELENTIFKCTNISNKCVWHEDHKKLLLFLLIKDDALIKCKIVDKIRVKLLHVLPKQSFPDYVDVVSQFPLTENGKVDQKALLQIYKIDTKKSSLPPNEVFSMLWCKYFGLSRRTLARYKKYNFFEMGGNSILIIQFKNELCDTLNCEMPSDFLSFLYEENFEFCENVISNYKITKKRTIVDEKKMISEQTQILQNEAKMFSISWKCDLKACVDCSPVELKLNSKTLIGVGSFSNIFGIYYADTGEEYCKFILSGSLEKPPCISVNCDKVFIGCLDHNLYCLNIKSKTVLWLFKTDDIIKCTPCYCLKNTAIVFGSYDKNVYCLEEKTGKLIWKTPTSEKLTSSPICYENIFIAGLTGTCMCLKQDTGMMLWTINTGSPIFGSPSLYSENLIWPDVTGLVHGINMYNGHENWFFKVKGMIYSSIEKYENLILFGSHDHHVYCIELIESTCSLKFKVELDSAVFATPTVCKLGNKKYVLAVSVSGKIYLIDFYNHQICTSMTLPNQVYSSPIYCHGQIYVGCRDNNLYCIKITE